MSFKFSYESSGILSQLFFYMGKISLLKPDYNI